MALKGCYACIKYLVIIFNFLFWLAGIGVLALSVYSYIKGSNYAANNEDVKAFFTPLYILMAAGVLMTILGFLGCCGALRESQCMLGTFFFIVLVILVSEIAAGIWAFMYRKEAKQIITKALTKMIQEDYGKESIANKTIDAIQHDLKCCGAAKPQDWAKANYNILKTNIGPVDNLAANTGVYDVPPSCCKRPEACETKIDRLTQDTYSIGCIEAMEKFVNDNLTIVGSVGIGLGVIQILGLIFSIVLCCAIRNGENVSYHV